MSPRESVRSAKIKRQTVTFVERPVAFRVSPWQDQFLRDDHHTTAAIGGIGSGKTFAMALWTCQEMRFNAGTGTVGGLFANTYEQLAQATLPKLWEVFETLGMVYGDHYVYNEAPPRGWVEFRTRFKKKHNNVLSVRTWGQVITRSLDNYKYIRGVELGFAGLDETRDTKFDAFRVVLGRLRCPRAKRIRLRMSTSPQGFDWMYDEFVERMDKFNLNGAKDRRLIQMTTKDNFFLPSSYYETLAASYDARYAEQELAGKFVSLTTGMVYHAFDRRRNVKGWAQFNPALPLWVCFDFNRSPMSVCIAQVVPKGFQNPGFVTESEQVWVIAEVSITDAGTEMACQEVLKKFPPASVSREVFVHGDPSGKQRDTRNNRTDYDIITQILSSSKDGYGNRFRRQWRESHPAISARINAMNGMMRNSIGVSRMFVSPECREFIKDCERCVYKIGTDQVDKTSSDEMKLRTHQTDALGYMIADRFPVRKPQARRISI